MRKILFVLRKNKTINNAKNNNNKSLITITIIFIGLGEFNRFWKKLIIFNNHS